MPASRAAILVSVFLTTAYVALPASERRSSLSCATDNPRYSVSTAADDSRNDSVSSATAAALSGLAIGLLSQVVHDAETPRRRRAGRERRPVPVLQTDVVRTTHLRGPPPHGGPSLLAENLRSS